MTVQTMTLTDFLLARIAEDEATVALVESAPPMWAMTVYPHDGEPIPVEVPALTPARVLAEFEAKRTLMRMFPLLGNSYGAEVHKLLAMPYADHPDYRDEWRP